MCQFVVTVVLACGCKVADPSGAVLLARPCNAVQSSGGYECKMTKVMELKLAGKMCRLHQQYGSSLAAVYHPEDAMAGLGTVLELSGFRTTGPPFNMLPTAAMRGAMDRDVIGAAGVRAVVPDGGRDVEMKDVEEAAEGEGDMGPSSSSKPVKPTRAPVSRKGKGKATKAPSSEDDDDDDEEFDTDDDADFKSSTLAPATSPRKLRSRPHADPKAPLSESEDEAPLSRPAPHEPAARKVTLPTRAANKYGPGKPASKKAAAKGCKPAAKSALEQELDCTQMRNKVWTHLGGRNQPDADKRSKYGELCGELDKYRSLAIGCKGSGPFRPRDLTDFLLVTWPKAREQPMEDPREGESKDIYLALLEWARDEEEEEEGGGDEDGEDADDADRADEEERGAHPGEAMEGVQTSTAAEPGSNDFDVGDLYGASDEEPRDGMRCDCCISGFHRVFGPRRR